ncbi:hypothetical protein SAMN06296386_102102 [Lachnospiraceae bacterium]|nr:hypothetical protein SAMN06296386_102102 [Lachnospiraceae bacterium]
MKVAVYCGSLMGADPDFEKTASELGDFIGSKGGTLVWGCGNSGLMNTVADHTINAGGHAIGVIPGFMKEKGYAYDNVDQMYVTETMAERKSKMIELADHYVALPGGPGTLEEIAEVISYSKLGLHNKYCILCNVNGFYDMLKVQIEKMCEAGFVEKEDLKNVYFANELQEVFDLLS